MNLIDGTAIAQELKKEISAQTKQFKRKPGLAALLVGDDPASRIYVNSKEKACDEVGFNSKKVVFPESVSQQKLEEAVFELNQDNEIDAILVQLPLPKHLDEERIINLIDPAKDVDCLHPYNLGRLMTLRQNASMSNLLVPCTPKGIMRLLKSTGVDLVGKKAVVVGRSQLVGKPVAMLLLAEDATVTMCHSQTLNLIQECLTADIIVAAAGRPHLITGSLIKPGAIVIDVGINRTQQGLVGDVEFNSAQQVAGWLTPVPGGVGPMTIACLLENTLILARNAQLS